MAKPTPLVVDLDGTLPPTDTLIESVIQLVKRTPHNLFAHTVPASETPCRFQGCRRLNSRQPLCRWLMRFWSAILFELRAI